MQCPNSKMTPVEVHHGHPEAVGEFVLQTTKFGAGWRVDVSSGTHQPYRGSKEWLVGGTVGPRFRCFSRSYLQSKVRRMRLLHGFFALSREHCSPMIHLEL